MAKIHRDTVADFCIDILKKTEKSFIPLILAYFSNEDKVVCDISTLPYVHDGSEKSEDYYVALGCVGARIGETIQNRDDLTRLYMAIETTHKTNGKPVLALMELDITEGTQIQRGYYISSAERKNLTPASFFEERTIITPRLAIIASSFYGMQGTLEKNKYKIQSFFNASVKTMWL